MSTILGLPAHPLVVHLAVVLVPVTATAVVVAALRPSFRRHYHVHLFVMAVIGFLATLAARRTGEEMYTWMQRDPPVAHHRELANAATLLVLLFVVATGAMAWVERRATSATDGSKRTASTITNVVAILAAVLATVWIARTGHEGARLTWKVTVEGGR